MDGLDLDDDPDTDTTEGDVTQALTDAEAEVTEHTTLSTATNTEFSAEITALFNGTDLDGDSVNVLKGKLTDAEEALASSNEAAAEKDGLPEAISAAATAQSEYKAAVDAEAKAENAFLAEVAKANELAGTDTVANVTGTGNFNDLTKLSEGADVVTLDSLTPSSLIVVGENGQLEAAADVDTSEVEGFDALLAAAQASYDAEVAQQSAQASFEDALASVLEIETPAWNDFTIDADGNTGTKKTADGLYAKADGSGYVVKAEDGTYWDATMSDLTAVAWDTSTSGNEVAATEVASGEVTELPLSAVQGQDSAPSYYDPATGELGGDFYDSSVSPATGDATLAGAVLEDQAKISVLEGVIAEREELLADVEEAEGLVETLEGLEDDIQDAEDAITDPEEDGGLGITLLDLGQNASADSDLYVFADDLGKTANISNFGASGEDKIYFGEDFALVELGSEEEITDRVGATDQLEIFWEQDGANLNLYVEGDVESGRDNNTDDMTTIVLAGVSSDDINFADGYLSAGEVA